MYIIFAVVVVFLILVCLADILGKVKKEEKADRLNRLNLAVSRANVKYEKHLAEKREFEERQKKNEHLQNQKVIVKGVFANGK